MFHFLNAFANFAIIWFDRCFLYLFDKLNVSRADFTIFQYFCVAFDFIADRTITLVYPNATGYRLSCKRDCSFGFS